MDMLACIDRRDYDPRLPHSVRRSVRAVIVRDGLVVMIKSRKYGEYKFPGGGMKHGETQLDTLVREVREETGLTVIPSTVREFGMVRELRRDMFARRVFVQDSYYYLCDAEDKIGATELEPYERALGYRLVVTAPAIAIKRDTEPCGDDDPVWLMREVAVLKELERRLGAEKAAPG